MTTRTRSKMAVREGVEPSIPCDIHTFQACSFGHSDTSPIYNTTFLANPRLSMRHARYHPTGVVSVLLRLEPLGLTNLPNTICKGAQMYTRRPQKAILFLRPITKKLRSIYNRWRWNLLCRRSDINETDNFLQRSQAQRSFDVSIIGEVSRSPNSTVI